MYRVELDKITGILVGETERGAYRSRTTFPTYEEASAHADKIQDRLNAQHNHGGPYFPFWEQRILPVETQAA